MRLKKALLVFLISTANLTYGQIKIGDNPQNINQGSVLELESTSRALVITRVNTSQMNAITPLQGAMVYNTNTQCIHYYNGSQWLNLCDALANSVSISLVDNGDGTYTFSDANNNLTEINNLNESLVVEDGNLILTDSAGNAISVKLQNLSAQTFTTNATAPREFPSILITTDANGTNFNFEVGVIDGLSIQDGSIRQIDLAGASVGSVQLRDNSVGNLAIADNAVGSLEIINGSVQPIDLGPGNSNQILTTNGAGAVQWVDQTGLVSADEVTYNNAISNLTANNVQEALDEVTNNINTLTIGDILTQGNDAVNQNIRNVTDPSLPQDAATKNYVDQAITAGTADGSETILNNGTNINITGTGTSGSPYVINNTFTEVDGSVTNELQSLSQVLAEGNAANNSITNLTNPVAAQDAATKAYVDAQVGGSAQVIVSGNTPNSIIPGTDGGALYNDGDSDDSNELSDLAFNAGTSILTLSNPATPANSVDLSSLSGTGTDDQNLTGASLTGNILQITIEDGTPASVDLGPLSGVDTDDQTLSLSGNEISISEGNTIDLTPILSSGGSDDQQLTLSGTTLTLEDGGTPIELAPFLDDTDDQSITDFTFDNATNILTLTIDGGNTDTADLSALAGGGNPTASDVTFTPIGNTASNDVQLAIEELQTEIDGISGGGAANPNDELITSFTLTGTNLNIAEGANVLPPVDLDPVFATNAELANFSPDWTSLTNIPADIADGDDDTTYSPGIGLTLNGTVFDVDNLTGDVTGPTSATVIADDAVTAAMLNPSVAGTGILQEASGALSIDPASITGNGDITSGTLTVGGDANALLGNVTIEIPADAVTAAMLNPSVAGTGILQEASGALSIDPASITGNGDITSGTLTVGGDANALLGNVTIEIPADAVTAAMLNPSVAGTGILQEASGALSIDPASITGNGDITSGTLTVGGDANALLGNVTIEIPADAVTAAMLNPSVAGTGILQEASGALSIDPASITGNGDITSGTLTVGGDANALLGNVTIEIPADAVTAAMLNPSVAGTGILQEASGALSIDPASITGNGDITSGTLTVGGDANALLGNVTIEIPADAVTAAMLNPSVAGTGILQEASGALSIDPASITGNGDITSGTLTVGGDANALLGNVTIEIPADAVTAAMLNPSVAGTGILQEASGALSIDPASITGNGDITSGTLTVGGDANALLGNVTIEIPADAVTAAMLNPSVAGTGILQEASGALSIDPASITGNGDITSGTLTVGGDANALLGNVTIEIPADAVTAAMLNPSVAGTGILQEASGALSIDPASITGNGDITSGTLTVGGDANALLGNVTIEIPADAVTAAMLNPSVAGTGILQEASGALSIDPASITGNGDITSGTLTVGGDANALLGNVTIEIPADAVTAAMLNPSVAGTGILQEASGALSIDPASITGNGDITSGTLTVGGDANALLGNVTIEIPADAVTAAMLNPSVAGTGILQEASGALSIDPASITGNGDITSGTLTVGGDANALLGNVTIEIPADAVTAAMLNPSVAGTGILQEASGALSIDPASITGNGDITSGTLTVGGDANALLGNVTIEIAPVSIINTHISTTAAIAGTKINPNFGTQNVITSGTLDVGDTSVTGDLTVSNSVTVGATQVHPDYVFQKYFMGYSILNESYDFHSLAQIEAFVKKYHHLPGIKSAAEVKKDGFWNLSESNLQNLEKIEELFLHTIEQEKKIQDLKSENDAISKELKSLRKDMEEIKALIKKE